MPKVFKYFIPIIIAILCVQCTYSQTGRVNIQIEPDSSILKMDNQTLRSNPIQLKLNKGQHTFKAWSPRRELYTKSFDVRNDTTINIYKSLLPAPEYVAYRKELSKYKYNDFVAKSKNSAKYISSALTVGFIAYFIYNSGAQAKIYKNKATDQFTLAENAKIQYSQALSETDISGSKTAFDVYYGNYKSNIDKSNYYKSAYIYQSIGVSVLLAGISYYLWTRKEVELPKKPVYNDTSKLLSRLNFDFNYSKSFSPSNLTIKYTL